MKQTKTLLAGLALLSLGLSSSIVLAAQMSKSSLAAEAKVTEADARTAALALVPNGTVQSAELEKERGKLVWSFDIKQPKSPNVIEILVDAKTGRIVSRKAETPAEEAREAKADKMTKP